ncbi:MAG: hypothetical protein WBK88_07330 [Methanothrix sp.]
MVWGLAGPLGPPLFYAPAGSGEPFGAGIRGRTYDDEAGRFAALQRPRRLDGIGDILPGRGSLPLR